MSANLQSLYEHIWQATHKDYFLGILITSQAQAAIPTHGWGFGAGKSNVALGMAKQCIYEGDFEQVKQHLIGFAKELNPYLKPPRTLCVVWDDMQIDVGKNRAHDKDVRELAYFLTIERPHLSVLIGTAPHRGLLQKDFREELFHFEVIVPMRGLIEVQKLKRWIPFDDPLNPKERLEPFGAGPVPALLPDELEWYKDWREKRNAEAKKRVKLLQETAIPEPKELTYRDFATVFRESGLKGDDGRILELFQKIKQ